MSSMTAAYFGIFCLLLFAFLTHFVTADEICYAFQDAELGAFFGQFRCAEFCCGNQNRKYCCNQCRSSVYQHDCPKEITGEVVGGTLTFIITIVVLFVAVMACKCGCCKKNAPNGENGTTQNRLSSLATLLPSPQLLRRGLVPGAACLTKPPPYPGESPPPYSEATNQNLNSEPDVTVSDLSHEHDEALLSAGNQTCHDESRSRNINSSDSSAHRNVETDNSAHPFAPIDANDPPPPYVSTERV
ncbi:protein shisa-5-like [Lineus longissimus]|uniref:protein shisa-5-like n=1 Tax=Lineus longissimus TaxID=88925 RepID=UPI002B4DC0C7